MTTAQRLLEHSIKAWKHKERLVSKIEMGGTTCPLCVEYSLTFDEANRCKGCPIQARTGRKFCQRTPYGKAHKLREKFKAAIQEELAFLRGLREDH